jgi:protease I
LNSQNWKFPATSSRPQGATVDIISLQAGEIKGWDKKDWGRPVKVDKTLGRVSAADYDAIVLPGGQINPDLLHSCRMPSHLLMRVG